MTRLLSINFYKTYGAWLLLPFLGVFFGALASTANVLIIAMSVSAFVGILLLRKPVWNMEVVLISGLIIAGIVPLFFEDIASKAVWGISLLGFMLLISAFYRLITTSQLLISTPVFIWIALLYFVYATADSIVQFYSPGETVGGFKRYFQVWGLLLGFCWIELSKKNIDRWRNLLLGIFLLQAPFALYENIVLVPIRESFVESYPGLEPIDVVAGTFGALMYGGGNNAEMATTLIMIFAFLLARYKEKILTLKKLCWISAILLAPLFMGETKIMIIFFPLMLATLYRNELLTRPQYLIAASIFGSMFVIISLNIYMAMAHSSMDQIIYGTLAYNVYELGYGTCSLNRTTVLTFWAQHQGLADPVSFLFGNGLGSTEEGGGGHIDIRYSSYCIGLTGVSQLLWELGVMGVSLFLLMMVSAWRCTRQLMKKTIDPMVRADVAAIQTTIVIFTIYPLYRGTLLSAMSFQVVFSIMLGYLAWLHKQQKGVNHER